MRYERAVQLAEKYSAVIKRQVVGDYELFDYWYADWDMFQSYPETREFRGITFDLRDFSIVSRPFHKFFNIGQNEETTGLNIVGTYAEKRDGSMVQATMHKGKLFVASRSSMTGYVNETAYPMIADNQGLMMVLRDNPDYTFMFELEDKKHTIVLRHSKTQLVFLASRHKVTGEYNFEEMPEWAGVEQVYYNPVNDLAAIQEKASEEQKEGYVFWVDGYGPVKWKTPWYIESHYLVTEHSPKLWVGYWANDDLDDVLASLYQLGHDELAEEILEFTNKVSHTIKMRCVYARAWVNWAETRKEAAIDLMEKLDRKNPIDSLVFGATMKIISQHEDNLPLHTIDVGGEADIFPLVREMLANGIGKQKEIADLLVDSI